MTNNPNLVSTVSTMSLPRRFGQLFAAVTFVAVTALGASAQVTNTDNDAGAADDDVVVSPGTAAGSSAPVVGANRTTEGGGAAPVDCSVERPTSSSRNSLAAFVVVGLGLVAVIRRRR